MRARLSVLALFAIAAAACGGSDSTSPSGTNSTGTPSQPSQPVITTSVTLGDDFFNPSVIQVSAGQTVTWTWSTSTEHNITFGDGGSGDKGAVGATFQKTFPTTGTFLYSCSLHPGMDGEVDVK